MGTSARWALWLLLALCWAPRDSCASASVGEGGRLRGHRAPGASRAGSPRAAVSWRTFGGRQLGGRAMTSAAHPDCDSPGAGPSLRLQVWLSTGLSSECFSPFPGDSAATAAFVYLWVSEITERGRGVETRLNQVTLPSLVQCDTPTPTRRN
ncbi:hypothetical protein NN561_020141 [Cricetulus griseus]